MNDPKETHLKTALWIPDASGEEKFNKKSQGGGYAKRQLLVNNSAIIPFSCQLHCDFWNNKRFLPPNVNQKLRLVRNQYAFSIITETSADYKIKILDLRLVVRKIKPSDEIVSHHQKLWNTQDALFQFHQAKISQHLITAGVASAQISIVSGVLPKQVRLLLKNYEYCL